MSEIDKYVVHDRTRVALEQFVAQPSHGLLLLAPTGAGKRSLAEALITSLLDMPSAQQQAAILRILPEKRSVSIEAVRDAQSFVRLKTTGQGATRRAILVEDAQYMTREAQNAFLKLLEEPPADTVIILTVNDRQALLPTILSRAPQITVQTPPKNASIKFFGASHATKDVEQAYHMANGLPGLMAALLDATQEHELRAQINNAKLLLGQPLFERLVMIDQLTKQNTDLAQFLWAVQRVSEAALQQAATKNSAQQVRHWQKIVRNSLSAQERLRANPQAKLLLTDLALQI